jgi:hypothetical protein
MLKIAACWPCLRTCARSRSTEVGSLRIEKRELEGVGGPN